MKKVIIFILLFSFLTEVFAAEKIVFGINPWRKPSELYELHKPIIDQLEQKLNIKIEFYVSKSYADLIEKAKSSKIDLLSFSPNLYVQAKNEIPKLKYLATVNKVNKHGELVDSYYSYIIGLKSKNINKLEDLKGKNFGFINEKSTSGYIYPNMMMKQQGIDPQIFFKQVFFLGQHHKVQTALAKGIIEGAATPNDRYGDLVEKYGDIVNILMKSDPIPYDAYTVAPHINEKMAKEIQNALLSIKLDESFNYKNRPMSFTKKSDAFYNTIRDAKKFLNSN